jgi:hypothetical protein
MPDTAWKAFERRIASVWHGKRRGAYTGSHGGGRSDVIVDGWSIECKLLSKIGFQDMLEAARQAERNGKADEIPVAVVKRKGDRDSDALVVMRLEMFEQWFINERWTIEEA